MASSKNSSKDSETTGSRLSFDKEKHIYLLDNKPVTGVTTILGVINKPALINWAVKTCFEYADEKIIELDPISKEGVIQILEEARKQHNKRKTDAADMGTEFHEWVEEYFINRMGKNNYAKKNIPPHLKHMADPLIDWVEENMVEILKVEERVYSEKYWYAGTLDFVAKLGDKIYLGDLKTSSGIWHEYWYQCAAYRNALEEMYDFKVDGSIIVNVKKDGKIKVETSEDYENERKGFMCALGLYRLQDKQQNKWKTNS